MGDDRAFLSVSLTNKAVSASHRETKPFIQLTEMCSDLKATSDDAKVGGDPGKRKMRKGSTDKKYWGYKPGPSTFVGKCHNEVPFIMNHP